MTILPKAVYKNNIITRSCLTLATPWTAACQATLSMGFSRQKYWSGLPFPPPGDLPNPGIKPKFPALLEVSLSHCRRIPHHLSHQGSPRLLEWVAYPRSRGTSHPRNPAGVSCIAGRFFTSWAIRKPNFRPSQSNSHLSSRVAPDCCYLELPTEFMQSNFNMHLPVPWSEDSTEGFNNPG